MLRCTTIFLVTLLALLLVKAEVLAQLPLPYPDQPQRRVTITWQSQELATALERLADATHSFIWLDRRVDRQQAVSIKVDDLPLKQALENLALEQRLGISQLGELIYIGPQQTADYLPVLVQQAHESLKKSPRAVKRRWLKTKPTQWPHLSEPRGLATEWASETPTRLAGGEQIPHDLWKEKSLPPMSAVDRLVLLLAGFDLTCQFTSKGKVCQIVPIDYAEKKVLRRQPPQSKSTRPRTGRTQQLFSLSLEEQRVGRILDQLSQQLGLEVVWESEAASTESFRERRISCEVKDAELEELLQSILAPAGLRHQQKDKQIIIQEAQQKNALHQDR